MSQKYGIRPSVIFKEGLPTRSRNTTGTGKIALIAPFPTVSSELMTFDDIGEARDALGIVKGVHDEYYINGQRNNDYYSGAGALKRLFGEGHAIEGAEQVLVCNTTTSNTDANGNCIQGLNTSLYHNDNVVHKNTNKLDIALSKLKTEKYDGLLLGYSMNYHANPEPVIRNIRKLMEFQSASYRINNPNGLFIGINNNGYTPVTTTIEGENNSTIELTSIVDSVVDDNRSKTLFINEITDIADMFEEEYHSLYSLLPKGLILKGERYPLNSVESAAYLAGFVASEPVDESFTQKVIPDVVGVTEELSFDPTYEDSHGEGSDGYKLIEHGVTALECLRRGSSTSDPEWCVVNSRLPCGFDLAHLRTAAYVIKQITLSPYLGKVNRDTSLDAIDAQIATVTDNLVNRFPIIESINHALVKANPSCIKIYIKINFYGIIINEVCYVDIGVEE